MLAFRKIVRSRFSIVILLIKIMFVKFLFFLGESAVIGKEMSLVDFEYVSIVTGKRWVSDQNRDQIVLRANIIKTYFATLGLSHCLVFKYDKADLVVWDIVIRLYIINFLLDDTVNMLKDGNLFSEYLMIGIWF